MATLFFFSLGLVGIAALIGASGTARNVREVLLFGLFGGVLMGLNCFALKFVAGLQVATNGDDGGYVWFKFAVFLTIVSLAVYLAVALKRLYRQHRHRADEMSQSRKSKPAGGSF